jgi:hypothetical protein
VSATDTRQLQLWDAETKSYIPQPDFIPINEPDCARKFANAGGWYGWRIARAERVLKPQRYVRGHSIASDHTAHTVCSQLRDWAQKHGRHVTEWRDVGGKEKYFSVTVESVGEPVT